MVHDRDLCHEAGRSSVSSANLFEQSDPMHRSSKLRSGSGGGRGGEGGGVYHDDSGEMFGRGFLGKDYMFV